MEILTVMASWRIKRPPGNTEKRIEAPVQCEMSLDAYSPTSGSPVMADEK